MENSDSIEAQADSLSLGGSDIGGHWVTIDSHPVLIKDPIGNGKGFSRTALREHIKAAHKEAGGGVPDHIHKFAESLPDAFTHRRNGAYAGEVKRMLKEGGKEGTAIAKSGAVKLTDDATHAGGEDAINAFKDKYGAKGEDHYWALARDRAGVGFQDAMAHAHKSEDPELRFAAAIHDHIDGKPIDKKKIGSINAGNLKTGQHFTFDGMPFHVAEDEDGMKVLSGGKEFGEYPLDAIKHIPIDRGSLKTLKTPKLKSDDVAPFSASDSPNDPATLWLHAGAAPVVTGEREKSYMGQPVVHAWADALICGNYTHPVSGQQFTIDRDRIDRCVDTFNSLKANGFTPPCVDDHKETAANSNGFVIGAKRDGDRLMLLHRFIGEDSIRKAARNRVSVKLCNSFTDSKGKVYRDAITHSALTPCPVIPNQQGFSIAASRSAAATIAGTSSAPVYLLAAPFPQIRSTDMTFTPEQVERIKKLPGAANVTDDGAADFILSYAETAGQNLVTLAEERAILLSRAETAEGQNLELSRSAKPTKPEKPSASELYFMAQAIEDARSILLSRREGPWPKATLDAFEKVIVKKHIETKDLTLSREVEDDDYLLSSGYAMLHTLYRALQNTSPGAAPMPGVVSGKQSIELARVTPGADADDAAAKAAVNPLLETAESMSGTKPTSK